MQSLAFDTAPLQASICPTCWGIGFVSFKIYDNGVYLRTEYGDCPDPECPVVAQRRADRYAKICTLAQIPEEYQDLSFATWAQLQTLSVEHLEGKLDAWGAALAFVAARDQGFRFTLDDAAAQMNLPALPFASARKCSMVFSGPNGVGKTSLAVSIARALLDEGIPVVYVRLMELFDAIKERFNGGKDEYEYAGDAEDEAAVMRTYQQAPVLIIDEFPPDVTQWRKERAEQLVNYRYTHQMPTIITTNLSADLLIARWGTTTGHRIQAMAHWIQMGGLELRLRDAMVVSR
jgi:hypothetical protein